MTDNLQTQVDNLRSAFMLLNSEVSNIRQAMSHALDAAKDDNCAIGTLLDNIEKIITAVNANADGLDRLHAQVNRYGELIDHIEKRQDEAIGRCNGNDGSTSNRMAWFQEAVNKRCNNFEGAVERQFAIMFARLDAITERVTDMERIDSQRGKLVQ